MLKLGTLVSAKHLADCLLKFPKNLKVLDATWFLPNSEKNGVDNYKKGHIPGALHFNIDDCVTESEYEHMLPSASRFEEYVGSLGIDNNTHVVVYNDHPDFAVFSAPRVWFTFRAFGHNAVSILDGGLKTWKDEMFVLATGQESVPKKTFKAAYNPNLVKSFEDVLNNIENKHFQLIDARSDGRFQGEAPEPRPDAKPGHIPGSTNIPFTSILGPYTGPSGGLIKHGSIKSSEEIQKVLDNLQVDLAKPVTATCGTGVTACNLALAAFLCGKEDVSVYDGSWLEWYKRSTPQQRVKCPED